MAAADDAPVVLADLEAVKAVADPLRLQLLLRLTEPQTVKQVATELDVPPTRLYYHFRILETYGLIHVVRRRQVSGIVEKTYQSVGTSWTLSPDLALSSLEATGVLSALLNLVHAELSVALNSRPAATVGEAGSVTPILSLTPLALTEAELEEVQERIGDLLQDHAWLAPTPPPGKSIYHFFIAGYPARSPIKAGGTLRAARR